jgi:hypothetical protein
MAMGNFDKANLALVYAAALSAMITCLAMGFEPHCNTELGRYKSPSQGITEYLFEGIDTKYAWV